MVQILAKLSKALIVIATGLLFSMLIQSAWAFVGPDCTPGSVNCTLYTKFHSLVVGAGTSSLNNIVVSGNIDVVGTVLTDDIQANGGTLTFNSEFKAAAFGHYYVTKSKCTTCNVYAGNNAIKSGMKSNVIMCPDNDILLGCSGWVSGTTKKFYGTDIYKTVSGVYQCQTLANSEPMTSIAVCYSPDYSTRTGI